VTCTQCANACSSKGITAHAVVDVAQQNVPCRGAHTVRSVAAMINNCGILKRAPAANAAEYPPPILHKLCAEVYRIYCSADPLYKPTSRFCVEFRATKSHYTATPPVRFMGILDTVGALGVPKVC
jgi:uncharacterized protein (DUF2235 family)